MKCWLLPVVGCSLVFGSMDQCEANLNLWIDATLFLQSGSFAAVFLRVIETWGLVWASLAGAASLGCATAPGGSAGPGDVAGSASWSWSGALVMYSLDPTRS
jgi:hypothetical protein